MSNLPTTLPQRLTGQQLAGLRLKTGETPVPLLGVVVDAAISVTSARVTIEQCYRNGETQPIEAVYVFPLDESAAVCGFEVLVNGTRYVGEVREREEAFAMYDDAMAAGHGGYLLDEERPDVFTASVGNVPPGGEVLVTLTYVTELPLEGDAIRFTLPTTVSPRYAPQEDREGVGRTEAEALNPPRAPSVPYGLRFSATLDMPGRIDRVESPSHPVSVSTNGATATVTLGQRDTPLDRDLVLTVTAEGVGGPHARVEVDDRQRHGVALTFQPTFPVGRAPADVVFVVDRSGSMDGTSIAEVRNALQLCLRSLIPGCRFNIVGFGSRFEALFRSSRAYDEDSLAEASAHVASLQADLGGTEILGALEQALKDPSSDLPRQVVVLTDGEVTNTEAVIARVRQHAATARLFTFGIGHGASQHLLRGMARAGGGVAEFISPGERIEPKVVRQFRRLLAPALTDVRLNWGGLKVRQAPNAVPPVFDGDRLVVYGLLDEPGAGDVRLTGQTSAGPVAVCVRVDTADACAGSTVATLAARALIRDLEESDEYAVTRGSRQARRKQSRVATEIARIGIEWQLVSRETSFVAIETREVPLQGEAKLRRIPIAITRDWHGIDGGIPMMPESSSSMVMRSLVPTTPGWYRALSRSAPPSGETFASVACLGDALSSGRVPPRPLDRLVALQRADGSWALTPELADLLELDLVALEAIATAAGHGGTGRRALATALALAWLDLFASSDADLWDLLAGKAREWLSGVPAPGGDETWDAIAVRAMRSRRGGAPGQA